MVLTETIQDTETIECQFSTWHLTHPLCPESFPPSSGPESVDLCWNWLLSPNVNPPLHRQEADQGCRHGPAEEEGGCFHFSGSFFVNTKIRCDDGVASQGTSWKTAALLLCSNRCLKTDLWNFYLIDHQRQIGQIDRGWNKSTSGLKFTVKCDNNVWDSTP